MEESNLQNFSVVLLPRLDRGQSTRSSSPDPLDSNASVRSRPPAYTPNNIPLPRVTSGPSRASPTYGRASILARKRDLTLPGISWYRVELARNDGTTSQITVKLDEILKFVSCAELEVFENDLAREEVPPRQPKRRRARLLGSGALDSSVSDTGSPSPADELSRERSAPSNTPDPGWGSKRKSAIAAGKYLSILPKARKRLKKRAQSTASSSIDEEYEVEDILAHRTTNGFREYLVGWAHYPREQATWETEDDLLGASEIVQAYCFRAGVVPQLLAPTLNERESDDIMDDAL